jgi:Polyketide cyclase / dehydrase and lipid transport
MFDLAVCGTIIVNASAESCFEVVSDSEHFQDWEFFEKTVRVSEGKGEPDGLGSVRKFTSSQTGDVVEVINFFDRPRLFGYRVINESIVKDHQGIITVNSVKGGTELRWYMTANHNGLFSGEQGDAQTQMQSLIDRTVQRVKAEAEKREKARAARQQDNISRVARSE